MEIYLTQRRKDAEKKRRREEEKGMLFGERGYN